MKRFLVSILILIFCKNSFCQQQKIDSLLKVCRNLPDDTSKLRLLFEVCDLCDLADNLKYGEPALNLTNQLILKSTDSLYTKELLAYHTKFLRIIRIYYSNIKNKNSEAITFFKNLQPFDLKIHDTLRYENSIGDISNAILRGGNFERALDTLTSRLKYWEIRNRKKYIVLYLGYIGLVYEEANNPEKALQYYLKFLEIKKQLKDNSPDILRHVADQYARLKQPKKTLEYAFQYLSLIADKNNPNSIFWIYVTIKDAYENLNDFENALKYDEKCLSLANSLKDTALVAYSYAFFSDTYKTKGDYKKAEEFLFKSYDIIKKREHENDIMNCFFQLSEIYQASNRSDLALKYITETERIATKLKSLHALKRIHELKYKIYTAKKDYKSAVQSHLDYDQVSDSLKKMETHDELERIELKQEFNKKEALKQIEQEKKDQETNAERKKQNLITWTVLGGLIMVTLFAIFVFRSLRTTSKQKKIIELQKRDVEAQKHIIQEKQTEMLDSINYARYLQEAILPPRDFIEKFLPDSFILYKPKDIVAGDFYWAENVGDAFFIAAADSTGHGVPGAMVSVVCSNALNRAIKEFKLSDTGKILDKTRELVIETFEKSSAKVKDGMDISLLCIDRKKKTISWSGANNPLWYLRDGELLEIKANKQAIGKTDNPQPFTTHIIAYKENTTFYLFTDGLADQFGGPQGKKFKYKQFEQLLISINEKSAQEQSDIINYTFEQWKGSLEQVDDVCVIGVRV